MKHCDLVELLAAEASEAGIQLPEGVHSALLAHLELVLAANQVLNLTRIVEPTESVRLHLVDSLTALMELQAAPPERAADIGSGAGFPGIPLALVSGRHFDLYESVGKKAAFLEDAARQLGAPVTVLPLRAEEVPNDKVNTYGAVTARAVSALPSLIELAAPMLKQGGRLIALKGPITEEEQDRANAAGKVVGLRHLTSRAFALPRGGERRTIVVFEKVAETPPLFPRRPGMAQRRPLA